jgi:gluconate 2-dehydrogenase
MSKPKILVARAIFPETIERLSQHFEVESNQTDDSWSKEQLIAKLKGKQGAFTTGSAKRGAHGFGMKVVYHNRSRLDATLEAECKASYESKEELLKTADHVVLVVPYSPASHHTIGAAEIALMKPTATLINIARGGIVDDAALAAALRDKRIAAAGLDVFEGEPKVHPDLLTVPNVVLTPHIASATVPTRRAMADLAADNLIAYFSGKGPLTPVTPVPPAQK